jgi:hypothetical protein
MVRSRALVRKSVSSLVHRIVWVFSRLFGKHKSTLGNGTGLEEELASREPK